MPEFQHVRLSPAHPTVHLASTAITEANKTDSRVTWCGAGLRGDTLLAVPEPTTCGLCLRKLHGYAGGRRRKNVTRTQPVIDFRFRQRSRKGQEFRVVEIVYMPSEEADLRMSKALDILLNRSEPFQSRGKEKGSYEAT